MFYYGAFFRSNLKKNNVSIKRQTLSEFRTLKGFFIFNTFIFQSILGSLSFGEGWAEDSLLLIFAHRVIICGTAQRFVFSDSPNMTSLSFSVLEEL